MPTDREKAAMAPTRAKLMRATIDEVVAHGYAGATMARIARRAGVTRGAIQHHFGDRRTDIVACVTQDILARRQQAYETVYGVTETNSADSRAAMKAAFRDPETWFLIEVWIAARADPELGERVNTMLDASSEGRDLEFVPASPDMDGEGFRVLKYFLRSLTRGLALEQSRRPDDKIFDDVVDFAFDLLSGMQKPL